MMRLGNWRSCPIVFDLSVHDHRHYRFNLCPFIADLSLPLAPGG